MPCFEPAYLLLPEPGPFLPREYLRRLGPVTALPIALAVIPAKQLALLLPTLPSLVPLLPSSLSLPQLICVLLSVALSPCEANDLLHPADRDKKMHWFGSKSDDMVALIHFVLLMHESGCYGSSVIF